MPAETITIEPRFNGPPESGNGGYTCGRLAAFVDAPAVEVTLRLPPPLGRELVVERDGGGEAARAPSARLLDDGALVAEARAVESVDAEAPPPPAREDASEAESHSGFLDPDLHPFPTCFVCGPLRDPGDGLRIFAGPTEGERFAVGVAPDQLFAANWTPDPSLAADDSGTLPPELVWAALDCPTSAPVFNDPHDPDFRPIVLARLATRILRPVGVGEPHTISSWAIERDGRKRHSGAALRDAGGELLALARALWIELKPPEAS